MSLIKNLSGQKCSCNLINRLGPPPVYLLEPPPMPPLPIEFKNMIITNPKLFQSFLKCSISNNTKSSQTNEFIASNIQMNNSYFVIIIVVIVILIVVLLLFILFAFIIVYLTRLKLKKSENLNKSRSSSSKHESQQTVSVLTLTSPSFTQLSTSPNSTNSYNDSVEDRNLIFEHSKVAPLNSFSKLPLNENTFKPIQNNFNMSVSVASSSMSSTSPNKNSSCDESIETSKTNSTILTQGARLLKYSKRNIPIQTSENQHHYYESIGDISQLYFDVDDQNMYKRNLNSYVIPEAQPVQMNFERIHYPITCCSCTLMKYNTNQMNHSCADRNMKGTMMMVNGMHIMYDNTNRELNKSQLNRFQSSTSNLNSSNYLTSLIV